MTDEQNVPPVTTGNAFVAEDELDPTRAASAEAASSEVTGELGSSEETSPSPPGSSVSATESDTTSAASLSTSEAAPLLRTPEDAIAPLETPEHPAVPAEAVAEDVCVRCGAHSADVLDGARGPYCGAGCVELARRGL